MAVKKVTYKEPDSYFSPNMKKAAVAWEKAEKAKAQKSTTTKKK